MAKVPQFGNLMLNGTRNNIGQVSSNIPQVMRDTANLFLQKKKEDDQLQYQKALLDLDEFGSSELNDPDTGYKNLQGENAINQSGDYNQRYIDKANEIRESLKGNMFLNQYDLQTQNMHTSFSRQLMDHESRQQSALALKTMQSGIELAITNAQSLYNDPMSLDIGYKNLIARVDQFSSEQGMPEELRKTQIEGIKQNYFSSSLDGWVANTELSGGSFTALGEQMKESFAFKQLSEINQAKYLLKIDSLTKRQGNENKDSLKLDLNNAWEMQKRGIEAPNISIERFNSVYGEHGKQAYDAYQDQQIMARNIGAMQNMPTNDLISYTQESINDGPAVSKDKLSANTQDDNFADRLKLQNVRSQAALTLLKARYDDPIAAAYQAGEVEQLEYTDQNGKFSDAIMMSSFNKRVAQATRISNDYQTPLKVFSKTESEVIANMFDKSSVPEISSMLKTFRQSSGDNITAYNAILKQVSISHPSIAFAGGVLNIGKNVKVKDGGWFSEPMYENPEQISSTIILGRQSRKGVDGMKGYQIPSGTNNDPKPYFDKHVGNALAGSQQAYDEIYQTALDYYAGESVKVGDFSKVLNTDRWEKAMRAATGGVVDFNGSDVLLPYGMDETVFNDLIKGQYYKKVVNTGVVEDKYKANNSNIKSQYDYIYKPTESLVMPYQLERRQDGQYYVVNGTTYLYEGEGKNVKAIVLDVYEDN